MVLIVNVNLYATPFTEEMCNSLYISAILPLFFHHAQIHFSCLALLHLTSVGGFDFLHLYLISVRVSVTRVTRDVAE